jgi:hypothetical protein
MTLKGLKKAFSGFFEDYDKKGEAEQGTVEKKGS